MLLSNPLPAAKHDGYPPAFPIIRTFIEGEDAEAYAKEVAKDALVCLTVLSTAALVIANQSDASDETKEEADLYVTLMSLVNLGAIGNFMDTPASRSVGTSTPEERKSGKKEVIRILSDIAK